MEKNDIKIIFALVITAVLCAITVLITAYCYTPKPNDGGTGAVPVLLVFSVGVGVVMSLSRRGN